jgi:hypothetical protein
MRSIAFLLVLMAGLVLLNTCKGKEDPLNLCGEDRSKSIGWDTAVKTYPWKDPTWSTYISGTKRIFEVRSEEYSDVCPENYIYIYFYGGLGFLYTERMIDLSVKYSYGESGEYGSTEYGDNSYGTVAKNFNFSIADAYGSNRGKFYLYVRWEIADAKDIDTDFNYFKEHFARTEVTIHYSQF